MAPRTTRRDHPDDPHADPPPRLIPSKRPTVEVRVQDLPRPLQRLISIGSTQGTAGSEAPPSDTSDSSTSPKRPRPSSGPKPRAPRPPARGTGSDSTSSEASDTAGSADGAPTKTSRGKSRPNA